MDSVNVPISREDKILRDRVIEKAKRCFQKDPSHEGRWEEIYEDLSEAEYFVFYGDWLRGDVMGDKDSARCGEERWVDYRKRMLDVEKKCDEVLA